MHENRETSRLPVGKEAGRREKAEYRTSRMYGLEGSDRGVVPMNRSNKDMGRGEWGGKAADQGEHSTLETTDRLRAV